MTVTKGVFAENLKAEREARGMSQREFGDLIDVHQMVVSRWELGKNQPDLDSLRKISRHLGVTIDALVQEREAA